MHTRKIELRLEPEFAGNNYADQDKLEALFAFSEELYHQGRGEEALAVYNHAGVEGMGMEPITMEELPEALIVE